VHAHCHETHRRLPLDQLVPRMADPGFVMLHRRRPPSDVERPGHVSPSVLAMSPPRSKYVHRWRRHARRCPSCAAVFRYLGLRID